MQVLSLTARAQEEVTKPKAYQAFVDNTNRAATRLLKTLWQPRRFQDPVRCVNHFRVPGDAELSPGCRAVPNFMGARRFWRCGGGGNGGRRDPGRGGRWGERGGS